MSNGIKVEYHTFMWRGVNKRGVEVKGQFYAETQQAVESQLLNQGIEISEIKTKPKWMEIGGAGRIKNDDIVMFTRQMSTMVISGIPLVQALEIVAGGLENRSMQAVVMTIRNDVASGTTFADALRKHPKQFGTLYFNLVKAGEQSGVLDTVLAQLASYMENVAMMRGRVKKALFYPVVMLVVTLGISTLLLGFVVPQFQDLFGSFGAELPFATRVVINLSNFVQAYWWMIIIAVIGLGILHVNVKKRSEPYALLLDKISLKIFLFGELNRKSIIARCMRTLAITLAAGTPLVEALDAVADVASNRVYSKAILQIKEDVTAGQPIFLSMSTTRLFPNMVIQMVSIGEKAGELEAMLTKIADFYDEQVQAMVDGLSTLIEPVMIVVLGTIIGGFVVSMYLPIFQLGTVI
ncbi:MAG: type II secretion system F family protein [Coxiellaceae bacterium]|nr:type II secretion system F family protein [Coxiellaceae bacterium]